MVKKNNVIEETQELIQQIKKEYREGVDFRFSSGKNALKNHGVAFIVIISPRLKKIFRERFNFPLGVVNHLDYVKMDQEGGDLLYRIHNHHDDDTLSSADGRVWPEKEKGENCQVCGSLTFKKNGRMELWDREKTDNRPDPKIIAYFHPECAKKHFADKKQPNQNNTLIKEKLLRNLDKICLDPRCDLANSEALKQKGAEKNYGVKINSEWKEWTKKAYKVEIEGEEIELNSDKEAAIIIGSYEQREIKKALMKEIKQNPSEWEITEREEDPNEYQGGNYIIKHKSGRRHWDDGFYHFWGSMSENEKMGKEWDKIKSSLKGYNPHANTQKTNDIELEKLKNIFQKLNIKKIIYKNGKLTIEFSSHQLISFETTNNPEYQLLKDSLEKINKNELTSQELGINSENTSTNTDNSLSGNKYLWLVGGMALIAIISTILVFTFRPKKKKNN